MTHRRMYDSTNGADIPLDIEDDALVAGYVDGKYVTFPTLHHRFPDHTRVSITVTGRLSANVCDQERGDLTPPHAAAWAAGELGAGRHPTIYTTQSTWQDCKDEVEALGLNPDVDVSWWVAWFDHDGIPSGAVACQNERAMPGKHYDVSDVAAHWPGVDPEHKHDDKGAHVPAHATDTEEIVRHLPTLRHGSHGHSVALLQGLLLADGHPLGDSGPDGVGIDGHYGDRTEAAVKSAQRHADIDDDGICGHDTWTALLTGDTT